VGSTQTLYFSSLRFFCCFTENMILFRYETAGIENRIAQFQFVRFGNGEISVFPCSAAGMAKRKPGGMAFLRHLEAIDRLNSRNFKPELEVPTRFRYPSIQTRCDGFHQYDKLDGSKAP